MKQAPSSLACSCVISKLERDVLVVDEVEFMSRDGGQGATYHQPSSQAVNVVAPAQNPTGFASGMYDSPVATTPPKRPANEVYDEDIPFQL